MSDRRKLEWNQVTGWRRKTAVAVGTYFGAGLLPKMPGTWGTLFAMPLVFFANDWDPALRASLWGVLLIAGTWAGKIFEEMTGVADNQNIVMDEVVGVGITAFTVGQDPVGLLVAFVVFRFFDIVKIPPVNSVDAWSKKGGHAWRGGFGVMADDVVAGFQGLIVLWLLQQAGWIAIPFRGPPY